MSGGVEEAAASTADDASQQQQQEIFTYDAPWLVYATAWSTRPDRPFRLAVGSFIEDYSNRVQVVQLNSPEDSETGSKRSRETTSFFF
jgi:WD repeat-containing protein 68